MSSENDQSKNSPAGRLSRLAQARKEKEAQLGAKGSEPTDWMSGLRSDAPLPTDYSTGMDEDDEVDPNLSQALASERTTPEDLEPAYPVFSRNAEPPAPSEPPPPPPYLPELDGAPGFPFNFASEDQATIGNPPTGGVPEWLNELAPTPPPSSPTAPNPALPDLPEPPTNSERKATEPLPEWLLELQSGTNAAPLQPAFEPEPELPAIGSLGGDTSEMPDWLQNIKASSTFSTSRGEATEDDMPPWLLPNDDAPGMPARPSFGDVDVEQRLNFAFDEPTSPRRRPTDPLPPLESLPGFGNHPGKVKGITDLLGLGANQPPPATPSSASALPASAASADLAPWLQGMALPALPDLPATPDSKLAYSGLAPWLRGLPIPAVDELLATIVEENLPATSAPPPTEKVTTSALDNTWEKQLERRMGMVNPLLDEPVTNSRIFSIREIMLASNELSDKMLTESTEIVNPAEEFNQELDDAGDDTLDSFPPWLNSEYTPPAPARPPDEAASAPRFSAPADDDLPDFLQDQITAPPTAPASSTNFLQDAADSDVSGLTNLPQNDFAYQTDDLPDFLRDAAATQPGTPFQFTENESTDSRSYPALNSPSDLALPDFLQDKPVNDYAASPFETLPEDLFPYPPAEAQTPPSLTGYEAEASDLQPFNLPELNQPLPTLDMASLLEEFGSPPTSKPTATPSAAIPPATPGNTLDFLRDEAADIAAVPVGSDDAAMPPWLAAMASSTPATPPAPAEPSVSPPAKSRLETKLAEPNPPANDMPDWLASSLETTAATEPAKPKKSAYTPMSMGTSRAEEQMQDLPDWLREETDTPPTDEPTPLVPFQFESNSPPEEDNPLIGSSLDYTPNAFTFTTNPPEIAARVSQIANEPDEGDLPRLLRELESGELKEPEADKNVPDWLSDPTARFRTAEADFKIDTNNLPEWLADSDLANENSSIIDEIATNPPIGGFATSADAPSVPPPAAPPGDFPLMFGGSSFLGDVEGPAWLRSAIEVNPPPAVAAPLPPPGLAEPGGLPGWLRTVAPTQEEAPTRSRPSTSPSAATALQNLPGTAAPEVKLPPQLASASLLTALLASSASFSSNAPQLAPTESEAAPNQGLATSRLITYVLYALLAAAALVGLLAPLPVGNVAVSKPVTDFFTQIELLNSQSRVLIAYDWQVERSGEMRPLATSVTQHVMSRRSKILSFSLNPQGAANAERITDELTGNAVYGNTSYKYGQNYLNLGWRSGNEAALFSALTNPGSLNDYREGRPANSFGDFMANIKTLADFDLIIVLAGDESTLRTWVEQAGTRPTTRLVFATPQSLEPFARPYASVPNAIPEYQFGETKPRARALISGLAQGAQYNQLLADKNLPANQNLSQNSVLTALSLAALLMIGVLIGGNIMRFTRNRRNQ